MSEILNIISQNQKVLLNKMEILEKRLEALEKELRGVGRFSKEEFSHRETGELSVAELLEFPDTLRRTIIAASELGDGATAEAVAKKTGRVRNLESVYLNQLVRLGRLKKKRIGRKVFFSLK